MDELGGPMQRLSRMQRNPRVGLAAVAVIALAAAIVTIHTTTRGAAISPDSTRYIEMARNFAAGHGFTTWSRFVPGELAPEKHWPPFYPILLSIFQVFGCDALVAARWLGALLFAANVFLIGYAIYRYTAGLAWLAVIGAVIATTSAGMLLIHFFAWSEPPFILLTMISLLTLGAYATVPRTRTLLLSAIAAGLALVTRQAGLAMLATGAAVILLGRETPFARRLRNAVLFVAIGALPMGLWTLRNLLTSGAPIDRPFGFHPISFDTIRDGLVNVSAWFVPGRAPDAARWIALIIAASAGIVIAILYATRKPRPVSEQAPRLLQAHLLVLSLYVAIYLAMMMAIISFVDPPISLEPRILMPAFAPLIVLTLCAMHDATAGRPVAKGLLVLLCLIVLIQGIRFVPKWMDIRHKNGWGFESTAWAQSPTMDYLRKLPPDAAIFSNMETVTNFLLGRGTACIPAISGSYPYADPRDFPQRVEKMRQILLKPPGGVIVYLTQASRSYHRMPSPEELMSLVPLEVVEQFADGTVYRLAR